MLVLPYQGRLRDYPLAGRLRQRPYNEITVAQTLDIGGATRWFRGYPVGQTQKQAARLNHCETLLMQRQETVHCPSVLRGVQAEQVPDEHQPWR